MRAIVLSALIVFVAGSAAAQTYTYPDRYQLWAPGVVYDTHTGRYYALRADGVFDSRFGYVPYSPIAERRTKIREGYLTARRLRETGDQTAACALLREVIALDRKDRGKQSGDSVYAPLEADYCGQA